MNNFFKYQQNMATYLAVLWVGTLIFMGIMVYSWKNSDKSKNSLNNRFINPKDIFVDDLLLSTKDLQLGENVNLINITLNKESATLNMDSNINTPPNRKLVYSKILQQKIKTLSTKNEDGFTIKPLPQ